MAVDTVKSKGTNKLNYFKIMEVELSDSTRKKDYEKMSNYMNSILERYYSEIKYYSSFSTEDLKNKSDLQQLLASATNTINEINKMRFHYNKKIDK